MVTLDSYFNLEGYLYSIRTGFLRFCQSSLTGGDTANKLTLEHSPFYPPTNVKHTKQMSHTYTRLRNETLRMNGKTLPFGTSQNRH